MKKENGAPISTEGEIKMKVRFTKQISQKTLTFALILLVFCLANEKKLNAQSNLDLSFGNGGIVVSPITDSPYYDVPSAMKVQPDGKIVVCGYITVPGDEGLDYLTSFFIARYHPNGAFDASFGANG